MSAYHDRALIVVAALGAGSYGDTEPDWGEAATRTPTSCWLGVRTTAESLDGGPDPDRSAASMHLPAETQITSADRVEHHGDVYEVAAPPAPIYYRGRLHHLEIDLDRAS